MRDHTITEPIEGRGAILWLFLACVCWVMFGLAVWVLR